MNYLLATGSTVIEFPYSMEKLRSDNPRTSFPFVMSDLELREWGVHLVTEAPAPAFNEATEQLEHKDPELVDGSWVVGWNIALASENVQAVRSVEKLQWAERSIQNALKNTDYTQLLDYNGTAEVKEAFTAWRQSIRALPLKDGYPWNIEWPLPPEELENP